METVFRIKTDWKFYIFWLYLPVTIISTAIALTLHPQDFVHELGVNVAISYAVISLGIIFKFSKGFVNVSEHKMTISSPKHSPITVNKEDILDINIEMPRRENLYMAKGRIHLKNGKIIETPWGISYKDLLRLKQDSNL